LPIFAAAAGTESGQAETIQKLLSMKKHPQKKEKKQKEQAEELEAGSVWSRQPAWVWVSAALALLIALYLLATWGDFWEQFRQAWARFGVNF